MASHLLNINLSLTEELPDELQRTIERKPDFLKKVIAIEGENDYILQIEFQAANDPDMHFRMYEYHALLLRRYQLEVRQYVIYVGMPKLNMIDQLEFHNLKFKYEMINLKEIPYQQFLNTAVPEEIPLAILGDFGEDSIEEVLENIFKTLKSNDLETLEEQKIVIQLEVLSKLRKLQKDIIKLIPNIMALNYNIKEDERYKQGKTEGKLEGKLEGKAEGKTEGRNEERKENIQKLLKAGVLSVEQIAEILEVSIDSVKELQNDL